MGGLSEAELASLRTTVNQFLPETATIARTGLSAIVRVSPDRREWHLEGLPRFLPQQRWKLTFQDDTDVRVFDSVTVAGFATYLILFCTEPHSYSTSTTCYAVKSGDAAGNITTLTASTKRGAGALTSLTSSVTDATHLTALTLMPVGDYLFQPVSEKFMEDTFGMAAPASQIYRVYAQWPADASFVSPGNVGEDFPVKPGDLLVLPDATKRLVRAVEPWRKLFLVIYVEYVA